MEKEKEIQVIFHDFAKRAIQRLKDRKVRKYKTLWIPSWDENIKIRNLDYPEVTECMEMPDTDKADKYSVYLAVIEPNLQETAVELKENGELVEYTDIVDIFEMHEMREIATEVMKLSGYLGEKKVTVVEELKN